MTVTSTSCRRKIFKVAWNENLDGAANLSGPRAIETWFNPFASLAVAAELDGDTDLDILWGSQFFGEIAWFENLDAPAIFRTGSVFSCPTATLK